MITYEQAKEIALERAEAAGVPVNSVRELPHAYIFDDSEHEYDGMMPFVVRKSDGRTFNYWQYMQQTNSNGDDAQERPF